MAAYGGLSHGNVEFFRTHLGDEWTDADLAEQIDKALTTKPTFYEMRENELFVEELVRRKRPLAAALLKRRLTEQQP